VGQVATLDGYGALTEPATFMIKRPIPGPIERVWARLTDGELRRQWFAGGVMTLKVGGACEFVRRNDELTDPSGQRPSGMPEELRMQSRIIELDPPRDIAFTWGDGEVCVQLALNEDDVHLTLNHRRLPNRSITLMAAASWHMHLDILAARMGRGRTEPFWDGWTRLRDEYARRLPE
jgi:uncharacterized protein YndB with AHSA1/START domain